MYVYIVQASINMPTAFISCILPTVHCTQCTHPFTRAFCHFPQSCCLEYLDEDLHPKLRADNWTKLSLQNAANLCISLARWDPVALRGMQVLVFLDLLIHKFLEAFELPSYRRSLASAMEYLIKGCYSITK